MVTQSDVQGWAGGLEAVLDRIASRFGRAEPRRRAAAYLRGLLAPVGRKNGWQLAEAAGDATPDGVQDFLSRAQWDADAVRDDLHAYATEPLGDAGAVLVLDETGFVKKGTKSAGVQRQHTGTAGRPDAVRQSGIENSQVGVFLGYASRHGRALLDRALYLPEDWAEDADRRREARIPAEVAFTTKPKLGLFMLERARAAGVPFAWVAGASVYGADSAIRRWAERHRRGTMLAVTSGQRLSAGEGAKGPRLYDWACLPYNGAAPGFQCALLVRRSVAKPTELAFFLTHAPEGTTSADLVRIAGSRWSIESLFEQAKGEAGLDHYEVRSWVGWHRHITLAMFGLAYLAAVRRAAVGGCGLRNPRRRVAAAHGARGQAPALASGLGATTQTRCRPALVSLGPPAPAARAPGPLAQTAALHATLT